MARSLNTEIAAVVVTYHPDKQFSERLTSTMAQVDKLIIVDNCSNLDALSILRRLASSQRVELIENGKNLGVAAALNQGVQLAASQGYSWVLTLDQDSKPQPGMVARLMFSYADSSKRSKVGLVVPIVVDECSNRAELDRLCHGRKSTEVTASQTSGSLIRVSSFIEVGLFREDFFIDYVDIEYCLRLRRAGFSIVLSCNARLLHNLGASTAHRLLGRVPAVTSNHSPLRRYYIFRNRLLVIKMYAARERAWAIREVQALIKEAVKIMLFEDSRRKKCGYILRGIVDALQSRTGRLEENPDVRILSDCTSED